MNRIERVEIVAVGEELLSGATVDTNAGAIARELETVGIRVVRKTTVGDASAAIADAVQAALERTGAVITTGGLGPTRDDATKPAVARIFGRDLTFRPELWEALKARWGDRVPIPETNRSQAEVPEGADVFPNPRGTAPGLALQSDRGLCILLPGVPSEMKAILRDSVVPYLAERVGRDARKPFRRQLRTASIAEAEIARRVGDRLEDLPIEVAYLPEVAGVDVRLTCWARTSSAAEESMAEGVRRLHEILGIHIYAEGEEDLAEVVGELLRARHLSLALAESCTGGLIAERLTDYPGSSDFFWGGAVVYDNQAKVDVLGVAPEILEAHGAVSSEVAGAMAEGAARLAGTDAAVAVTGIAGPSGGTPDKPVGTIWIGVTLAGKTTVKHRHYAGTRDMIRARAAQGALDLLRRAILQPDR